MSASRPHARPPHARPYVIALTGSIGMGKSTAAEMFRALGAEVWDADAAVERLYRRGGAAAEALRALNPALVHRGAVDREALRRWVREDETALPRLNAVIHPLVAADRAAFLARSDADIVVLDIPLLFETGADVGADLVAVVSVPEDLQRARVLARPGMDEALLERILSRQMPDSEKRARADVVIPTENLDATRRAVQQIVDSARKARGDA